MRSVVALLVAVLVAALPLASATPAAVYQPSSERSFDQLGADDDTHALPESGAHAARAVRAPVALPRLPSAGWTTRREASEVLFSAALLAPIAPSRARRGRTIPRRCVPRLRVDSPDR